MKTPYAWKLEFEANLENFETDYVAMIEAIQRDALTDTMADTTAQEEFEMTKSMCESLKQQIEWCKERSREMQNKWHEARRYLRAANKGAQRNAEALELAHSRYWKMVNNEKIWKERDLNNHKTIVWNWLCMSDEDYRLKCGELSSQDLRNIRAVLKAMLGTSLIKHL